MMFGSVSGTYAKTCQIRFILIIVVQSVWETPLDHKVLELRFERWETLEAKILSAIASLVLGLRRAFYLAG